MLIQEIEENTFDVKELLLTHKSKIEEYLFILKQYKCCIERLNNKELDNTCRQNFLIRKQRINAYSNYFKIYFSQNSLKLKNLIEKSDLKSEYKIILKYRYLSNWEWKRIIYKLYGHQKEYYYDFEKYKDKVMQQHRQSLKQLQKLLIKQEKQDVYVFIAHIIFDNKQVSEIFSQNYYNTQIYKYLLSKYKIRKNKKWQISKI